MALNVPPKLVIQGEGRMAGSPCLCLGTHRLCIALSWKQCTSAPPFVQAMRCVLVQWICCLSVRLTMVQYLLKRSLTIAVGPGYRDGLPLMRMFLGLGRSWANISFAGKQMDRIEQRGIRFLEVCRCEPSYGGQLRLGFNCGQEISFIRLYKGRMATGKTRGAVGPRLRYRPYPFAMQVYCYVSRSHIHIEVLHDSRRALSSIT